MIKTGVGATKRSLTPEELKEPLRRLGRTAPNLGLFPTLQHVDDFFVANAYSLTDGYVEEKPSNWWKTDFGGIKCPAKYWSLIIHSKNTCKYPVLTFLAKFNPPETHVVQRIGLEGWSGADHNYVMLNESETSFYFWTEIGAGPTTVTRNLNITNLMPSDYDTKYHTYQIKINKQSAWLFIDGVIKAIHLFGVQDETPAWGNNDPYAICSVKFPLLEVEYPFYTEPQGWQEKDVILQLYGGARVGLYDGDPLPPLQLPIYTENSSTKWAGSTFDSAVTSHPVPVWGYSKKVFLFQSNAAGTIAIEVYAGGDWREVVSETVTANELWDYVLNLEVPIARLKYTPTNSDTIAVAECNLS
ncbi:hypothetical protein J7J18_00875 [bacterium]|nr:hypothetical protein [bacterium]